MLIEDLEVYRRLFRLALEVHELTMTFPKYEMYELGSQSRRSSNSAPANLAECFGNKHTNIYLEGISRSQGEIRETKHHLRMAYKKKYLEKEKLDYFISKYEECSKMLYGLEKSLQRKNIR
ncbi:MAG: four helix bundle protein [Patescibacteria group bacterium]